MRTIQAIAFSELSKSKHEKLLSDAISAAKDFVEGSESPCFEGTVTEEIAVEIAVCSLPYLLKKRIWLMKCQLLDGHAGLEDGS
jgi:hypothetical protein